MQGPTHALAGIAWQKITDFSLKRTDEVLHRVFPQRFSVKNLRWLIIPVGAFIIGHGLLDLFTRMTFHTLNLSTPQDILIILFNIVLTAWIFKKWVIRDWKNLKIIAFWRKENRALWKKYQYFWAVSFAWLIPDGEHIYHWIRADTLGNSPEFGYPLHEAAKWVWQQIFGPIFFDGLPAWWESPWAFFVELGVIFTFLLIIHLFSQKSVQRYIFNFLEKELRQRRDLYQKIKKFILEIEEDNGSWP